MSDEDEAAKKPRDAFDAAAPFIHAIKTKGYIPQYGINGLPPAKKQNTTGDDTGASTGGGSEAADDLVMDRGYPGDHATPPKPEPSPQELEQKQKQTQQENDAVTRRAAFDALRQQHMAESMQREIEVSLRNVRKTGEVYPGATMDALRMQRREELQRDIKPDKIHQRKDRGMER